MRDAASTATAMGGEEGIMNFMKIKTRSGGQQIINIDFIGKVNPERVQNDAGNWMEGVKITFRDGSFSEYLMGFSEFEQFLIARMLDE